MIMTDMTDLNFAKEWARCRTDRTVPSSRATVDGCRDGDPPSPSEVGGSIKRHVSP